VLTPSQHACARERVSRGLKNGYSCTCRDDEMNELSLTAAKLLSVMTSAYGTFGMQRLIFSAKYRLLVRGGCSRPKIRSGIRIRAQKQAESSG
jgi:hypothetical protein